MCLPDTKHFCLSLLIVMEGTFSYYYAIGPRLQMGGSSVNPDHFGGETCCICNHGEGHPFKFINCIM